MNKEELNKIATELCREQNKDNSCENFNLGYMLGVVELKEKIECLIDKDLCYEIYNDIYLETFYDEHDNGQEPICFDEFYENEWQDEDCRDWFLSIYRSQNE